MGNSPSGTVPLRITREARHLLPKLLLGVAILNACSPPALQVAEPAFLQGGILAFLEDGRTTREEVLFRLGTPNAHFEGERILSFAYLRRPDGNWIRQGRTFTPNQGAASFAYRGPTHNLVLVFGPQGVLCRHSMVMSK